MISLCIQEYGEILIKFNILRLYYVTHYCTWIECQPFWSSPEVIQEARFGQYRKIILKPLKNCIYSHFLEWLNWNTHELLHQVLIVMKITVEEIEKIVKSHRFLHLTSTNWLVLKQDRALTRDVEYFVHKGKNSRDNNLYKRDVQVGVCLMLLLTIWYH